MAAHAEASGVNGMAEDRSGLLRDAALPTAAAALAPGYMAARLAGLGGALAEATLTGIHVTRHKPGKRCVIEYTMLDAAGHEFALLAKIRSSHRARTAFRLQQDFRRAGFDESAPDGIGVPEPVGCIADLGLWLQRKIDGPTAGQLLLATDGAAAAAGIAARIAEAASKIHRAGVAPRRVHSIDKELHILGERLGWLGAERPALAPRLGRLLAACARRAAVALPAQPGCGIHRDYYADQIILADQRLYVIDFDLYCLGNPGLDIGNFIGHVIELAFRAHGRADALDHVGAAARERFLQLAGAHLAPAVDLYADLTLVRHIQLSTLFADRQATTEGLLALCEERLSPWLA